MSEWRDISTAPKDGTVVLLCEPPELRGSTLYGNIVPGRWKSDKHYVAGGSWSDGNWVVLPTHWMPLPDPPGCEDAATEVMRQNDSGAALLPVDVSAAATTEALPTPPAHSCIRDDGGSPIWKKCAGCAWEREHLECCNNPIDIDDEWGSRVVGHQCCGRPVLKKRP